MEDALDVPEYQPNVELSAELGIQATHSRLDRFLKAD
jgi:hypothetical protein